MKALEEIEKLSKQIQECQKQIREIRDNCTHQNLSAKYMETYLFDFDPKRVCDVCNIIVSDASFQEKLVLLKEWYNDIYVELTYDIIEEKRDGFNL